MTRVVAGLLIAGMCAAYALHLVGISARVANGMPDFPNYYYTAVAVRDGTDVYVPLEDKVMTDFGVEAAESVEYFADFLPVAVIVAPLASMDYTTAWWVLASLSTVAMVATMWMTGSAIGLTRRWVALFAIAALLTSSFRYLIRTNHFEVLLALLGVVGWLRLRNGRDPGVFWGAAAALKLFPALWVVALIRKRRTVVSAALTFIVVLAASVAVLGVPAIETYVSDVVPLARQWYGSAGNYSLLALGTSIGGESLGWLLTGLGVVTFMWGQRREMGADATFVSVVGWSLLLSPLSWINYLVIAAAPALISAVAVDWSNRRERVIAVGMLVGLLALEPIGLVNIQATIALASVPTLSLLLLATWAPAKIERAGREASVAAEVAPLT